MRELVGCYRNLKLISRVSKLRNHRNIAKIFAIY